MNPKILRQDRKRGARWSRPVTLAACLGVFLTALAGFALAQEAPPLDVPSDDIPARPEKGLAAGGWLFFPTVRTYTQYTDNLFQAVTNPISIWSVGIAPALSAEWTNGIHTTLLYGSVDGRKYPSDNNLNVFDAQAGFTQKYSPLPDLTFRVQGNYSHTTNATQYVNAIPESVSAPTTSTVLPNGNTVLPNGNIVTPSGQTIGHVAPTVGVPGTQTFINPSNQYSVNGSIEKILNRGFIGITGSIARTDYQHPELNSNYTVNTLSGRAAQWLGPLLYAYADGSYAKYTGNQSAYRVVGGLGTARFGLFHASIYFGHQGSRVEGEGSAGGEIYGAALLYDPTPIWNLSANLDETVNVSNLAGTTNLALNLPAPTALLVPVTSSTRATSVSLHSSYAITDQWSTYASLGYTHSEYLNSSQQDDAWLVDLQLRYLISEHLYLGWEYQYSAINSNVALTSSKRNFVGLSATYEY